MKVFIVHAHHEPHSFNSALTHMAVEELPRHGHEVRVSDLYAMGFDPVSDRRNFTTVKEAGYLKQQQEEMHAAANAGFVPEIQAEIDKLMWCDALVMQFPLWWFGLPAILKGWVDRVFAMGVMYGGGKWYDNGVMKGKRAMLSLSTGGPRTMYTPRGLNGDIHQILWPINHGILRFVGFDVLPPFLVYGPARAGEDLRHHYIEEFRNRLLTLQTTEPIKYSSLAEFDPKTFERI
jgi:NAD(P)H dehydrogenase (quinone)